MSRVISNPRNMPTECPGVRSGKGAEIRAGSQSASKRSQAIHALSCGHAGIAEHILRP